MGTDNKSRRGDKSSKKVHTELKKRKVREKEINDESQKVDQISSENDYGISFVRKDKLNKACEEKKKSKSMLKKKRKKGKETEVHFDTVNELSNRGDCSLEKKSILKKKRKKEKETEVHFDTVDELSNRGDGSSEKIKSGKMVGHGDAKKSSQSEAQIKIENSVGSSEAVVGTNITINKSKKAGKSKKKHRLTSKKARKLEECKSEVVEFEDIYHLSSVDDDCSKGMRKWLTEYHKSRPGLEILQQRIDAFITSHEAQEEQARKEREAHAAEGGWTVVVHQKGKKRTTDFESGISVGSVAQAAVVDKMVKKKKKGVALDFYNFQRREARRNEIMMLQSKFEQDKMRIQQMRAARKFRPY